MNKLTYSVIYTPSLDDGKRANEKGIDFLCIDDKVHIRLRDYDRPESIKGFINKLTFLLTYLANASNNSAAELNPDEHISLFCDNSEDFRMIVNSLKRNLEPRFSGIKLTKAYRKKGRGPKAGPLGSMTVGTAPLIDGKLYGDLKYFLDSIRLSLDTYLFDDAYSIQIQPAAEGASYAKFANKLNRKVSRSRGDVGFEYVPLC